MAASEQDVSQAGLLLTVYSLGLAVPYMALAIGFGSAPAMVRSINKRVQSLTNVSGIIMVAAGAIMILGI
jgi:cytochrome c-type biogenesis protein